MADRLPHPLTVLEVTLTRNATAGGARRRAMDEAAGALRGWASGGVLLTMDADSVVSPTWFADNIRHLEQGADCVAGYIDAKRRRSSPSERSSWREDAWKTPI